ncbi:hypothetical protein FHR90_003399 [Endobacter medicaginis]|uniref:Uncharacterized protein n=1 Tax=Endobacter medicaginis TaxID=1181271 RepID=A0A839V430_9PROT|nr:hypothetical protein [Endobacter medicaginis]MBB3175543.1 hypothetical protein [Endobacter medicaginis]MCX5476584.1 hypothetical protein [Endobacter medicaginis]NVN29034.1 hypothetical protein [Endobacter medicaginis]
MRKILTMWLQLMGILALAFIMFAAMAAPGFIDDMDSMVGPAPVDVVASR